jgi:hypothetical protein
LGQLDSQIGGTASHGGFPVRDVCQQPGKPVERGSGDPGITNYEQTSGALASELTQVFRGSGGAEADVKRYLSELDPNASEAQKKASIKNIAGLLQSRLNAIGDQYKKGMGTTADPLVLLDDHAQHVMGNLGFGGNGGATPPSGGPGSSGGPTLGGPPAVGPDARPAFNGPSSSGPLSLATGAMRTENDPRSSALIDKMVRSGATADQINAALPKDLVPITQEAVSASQVYLKNNPHYQGSFGKVTREVGNSPLTRMASTPLATVATQAANAGSAGYLDEITGGINSLAKGTPYVQERDAADIAKQAQAAGNPGSAIVGNVIGGGAAMAGAGALGIGGVAARYLGAAAPIVGDAAYGALYGSGESNGNRLGGAVVGAAGGAVGSRLGSATAGMFGRGLRGVQSEAVRYLDHAGIPMTGGQILGGVAKNVEDKLTSIPFVGEAIKNRRAEGYNAFNQAAFNQAGAPIGANVGAIGDNGLAALDRATGQAYNRALGGVNVNGNDPAFIGDMGNLVQQARNLPDPMAGNAAFTLRTRVGQGFDNAGNMTGNDFQQSVRGLRRDARAVAPLPYGHDFGQIAQGGENALEGLLQRQAPGALPQYRAANSAYRHQSTLDSVVNGAAKNQFDDAGNVVFTPAQLNAASVRNGGLFGGQRPFQELAQSGQQVLPSKVPDSGTAGRAALGLMASGLGGSAAGAATGYGVGDPSTGGDIGGGLGIAAALLNSRSGQRALTAALLRRPQIADLTGNFLVDNARYGGHLFAPGGSYLLSGAGR